MHSHNNEMSKLHLSSIKKVILNVKTLDFVLQQIFQSQFSGFFCEKLK